MMMMMMMMMMSSSFSLTQNPTFLTRREETVVTVVDVVVVKVVVCHVVDDDFCCVFFFDDDDFWQHLSSLLRVLLRDKTHARSHALSLSHMCVCLFSRAKSDLLEKKRHQTAFLSLCEIKALNPQPKKV